MNTDGIIFDLDGTLWDATRPVYDSWKTYLTGQGIPFPHTREQVTACMGLPMDAFFARLYPDMPEKQQNTLREAVLSYENQYIEKTGGILYPAVQKTLDTLSKKIPLMIVSNCQSGYIEAFFRAHNMQQYFTDWESFGGTGLLKADNIALVVKRNHLKAPVYVGDVQGDADASHKAGVPIIYAAYGFGKIRDAEAEITTFEDLLTVCTPLSAGVY